MSDRPNFNIRKISDLTMTDESTGSDPLAVLYRQAKQVQEAKATKQRQVAEAAQEHAADLGRKIGAQLIDLLRDDSSWLRKELGATANSGEMHFRKRVADIPEPSTNAPAADDGKMPIFHECGFGVRVQTDVPFSMQRALFLELKTRILREGKNSPTLSERLHWLNAEIEKVLKSNGIAAGMISIETSPAEVLALVVDFGHD